MGPFTHGDTITMIFYALYDSYSDISEPHELSYRVRKAFHQFGKKMHDLIHHMAATQEYDFVESFDAL